MIHDYDRGHWFGASDGRYIFADSQTNKSWLDWWDVKCGKAEQKFKGNMYTKAGNTFEHSILRTYDESVKFDRQIVIPPLRLRVNLDGNTEDTIYEVKTYSAGRTFEVNEAYFYQAQLQMLAWRMEQPLWFTTEYPKLKPTNPPLKHHYILAYALYPDEYYASYSSEEIEKGLIPIEKDRIEVFEIIWSRSYDRKARKILRKLSKRLRKEEIYV